MTIMRQIPLAVILDEWAAPGPDSESGFPLQTLIKISVMSGDTSRKMQELGAKIAQLRDARVTLTGVFDAGAITLRNGETLTIAYDTTPLT